MSKAQGVRAGRAFVEVYADSNRLARDFAKIGQQFRAFGASVSAVGIKMMGVGAAITAPLVGAIRHFAKAGDALDKMAARTGISTNALSELGFAAEQSGSSIEAVEKAIRYMQYTLGSSGKGTEAEFMAVMDELATIPDATERAQRAMQVFGSRSGTALLPMVGQIRSLREEAVKLGLSVGPEQAKRAAEMQDAWNRLKRSTMAVFFNIGSALAGSGLLDSITNIVGTVSRWVRENGQLIQTIAKLSAGLVVGGAALVVIGKVLGVMGIAIGGIAAALGSTTIMLAGAAAGLAYLARNTAPIKAVGNAIWDYLGDVRAGFGTLVDDASKAWQGISDALTAGKLDLAFEVVTKSIELLWARMVDSLLNIIEPFYAAWQDSWTVMLTFMKTTWASWEKMLYSSPLYQQIVGGVSEALGGPSAADVGLTMTGMASTKDQDIADLNAGVADQINANAKARQADMERRAAEVEAAERERDKALVQARQAADYARQEREGRTRPAFGGVPKFGEGVKSRIVGTFSGSAASGLGAGGPIVTELKRLVITGRETNRKLDELALEVSP